VQGTSTWTVSTNTSSTDSFVFSTDAWSTTFTVTDTDTDTTTQSATTTGNFLSNTDASGTSSGRTYSLFVTASDNGTNGSTSVNEQSVISRLTTLSGFTSENVTIGAPFNFHLIQTASYTNSFSDSQRTNESALSLTNRSGTSYYFTQRVTLTSTAYFSNTIRVDWTENGVATGNGNSGVTSASTSSNEVPPGTSSYLTTLSRSVSFSVGSATTTGNTIGTSTFSVVSLSTKTYGSTQLATVTVSNGTTVTSVFTYNTVLSTTTYTTSTVLSYTATTLSTSTSVSSGTFATTTASYKLGSSVSYNDSLAHTTARIYERDFWERLFTLTSSASSGLLTKYLSEGSPITWYAARTNIPAASGSGTYTNVSGDGGTTASGSTAISTVVGANTMALGTITDGTWLSSLHSLSTITVATSAAPPDPAVGRQQGAFAFTTTQLATP